MFTSTLLNGFDDVSQFCTDRAGGVSRGKYNSMNISPFSGDSIENVDENLERVSLRTGIPAGNFIIPYQTHETNIRIIDNSFFQLDKQQKSEYLWGVDALITNLKSVCIGITTADCVPLTLYDKKLKVVAAAHAGWRGTQQRIVQKTIHKMTTGFGTHPEDVFVHIGPSISGEVYNVGKEVVAAFGNEGFDLNTIFEERNGEIYLDLWKCNFLQITESDIPESQIEIAGICTFSRHEDFFSARRLGIKSGRMYSGIFLK